MRKRRLKAGVFVSDGSAEQLRSTPTLKRQFVDG